MSAPLETKPRWTILADPVHGIIRFDRQDPTHRLLLNIINSRPFQRLRRIRQMGMAEFVFPGATHTRFIHSLGALHLMMQTLDYLKETPAGRQVLESPFEDTDIAMQTLLLVGILVHDIGHGPLSHTLEDILYLKSQGMEHDHYWNPKILLEDPDLQAVWHRYNPDFPERLPQALLRFMGQKHFLAQLISSQLDMDRLDYLQRDSHFLGVQYGRIEAERILTSLEVAALPSGEPVIALREDAIPAVEHYLFGRHQAYKMALHSLDKASEFLIQKTLERFRWVRQNGLNPGHPANELYQLMQEPKALTTKQYLRMDDYYLWEAVHTWAEESEDPPLADLANRLLRHDLFPYVDLIKLGLGGPLENHPQALAALKAHYDERGLSFVYGFGQLAVQPKPLYTVSPQRDPIWIKRSAGTQPVVDLSAVSSLPLLAEPEKGDKHLVFVWDKAAKECLLKALGLA